MSIKEHHKVVGYCDRCEDWYKFIIDRESPLCPSCEGRPSNRHGYQVTTQRTLNPKAKKLTKAQIKKMDMGA